LVSNPTPCDTAIEEIDPLADDRWDAMVTLRADHSIFHRAAWARVLEESYGHHPVYLRICVEGKEAALVPLTEVASPITGRRGVSLPFSDFAGPLWIDSSRSAEVHQALVDLAAKRNWKHLEIRDGSVPPDGAGPFQSYVSHELDLGLGRDAVEPGFDPAVRRAIRKAERSELNVTTETGADGLEAYYALHCRTRRRHGLPPQPIRFFKAIQRNILGADLGFISLARVGTTPVAGAVFLRSANRAIYKFGASDPQFWHLRPNQLVIWSGISKLMASGCQSLHFGRTAASDDGLCRFKLSWGCTAKPLCYYRYGLKSQSWVSASHERKESHPLIFGHLPVAVNRVAGSLIYPHLD